jgi:hypothetical protein
MWLLETEKFLDSHARVYNKFIKFEPNKTLSFLPIFDIWR